MPLQDLQDGDDKDLWIVLDPPGTIPRMKEVPNSFQLAGSNEMEPTGYNCAME